MITLQRKIRSTFLLTTLASPDVSGTTAIFPVKTTLSPAFATSHTSFLHITSIQRGIDPGGTSSAFSCTRCFYTSEIDIDCVSFLYSLLVKRDHTRRCQSTKALFVRARRKFVQSHLDVGHTLGSVKSSFKKG